MIRTFAPVLAALVLAAALGSAPVASAQSTSCATCGVVQSIRYVEQKGEASGLGMVAGGVVGGVIGHQIGSGRGNTVATVAGAAGGAYAGNQIEKNSKKKSYYAVTIRLDNGKTQTLNLDSPPPAKEGERVKIVDGNRLALLAN
jgi:outer membrane lipoprotein SlyB